MRQRNLNTNIKCRHGLHLSSRKLFNRTYLVSLKITCSTIPQTLVRWSLPVQQSCIYIKPIQATRLAKENAAISTKYNDFKLFKSFSKKKNQDKEKMANTPSLRVWDTIRRGVKLGFGLR